MPPAKRRKVDAAAPGTPAFDVPVRRLQGGQEWPAPEHALQSAKQFLQEAVQYLKSAQEQTRPLVLVPDKDADGLSAGQILRRSLINLGVPPPRIKTHFMEGKGLSVHTDSERKRLTDYEASYIVVLDQGSRDGPGIVPASETGWDQPGTRTKAMVLDHHFIEPGKGPRGALVSGVMRAQNVVRSLACCRWSRPRTTTRSQQRRC